jgi:hypothetical protein
VVELSPELIIVSCVNWALHALTHEEEGLLLLLLMMKLRSLISDAFISVHSFSPQASHTIFYPFPPKHKLRLMRIFYFLYPSYLISWLELKTLPINDLLSIHTHIFHPLSNGAVNVLRSHIKQKKYFVLVPF